MRRAFVFDQEKCMGCNTCTVACKDWNQVNPGPVRWRTQITHEASNNPYFFPLSMSCNHCVEPACKTSCPVGAILKRESDGVVYIDRTLCQSYKSCISACPFGEPQIADDQQEPVRYQGWQISHPMQKCNFCMDRVDKGQNPACVDACPAHALEAGDYDELIAKYAAKKDSDGVTPAPVTLVQLSRSAFPYAYVNTDDTTNPSFLVVKRGSLTITEDID